MIIAIVDSGGSLTYTGGSCCQNWQLRAAFQSEQSWRLQLVALLPLGRTVPNRSATSCMLRAWALCWPPRCRAWRSCDWCLGRGLWHFWCGLSSRFLVASCQVASPLPVTKRLHQHNKVPIKYHKSTPNQVPIKFQNSSQPSAFQSDQVYLPRR